MTSTPQLTYDKISKSYYLSSRTNLKNYDNEIKDFLEWIKPYIKNGSGERDMYAIVTYEQGNPEIHYLLSEEDV